MSSFEVEPIDHPLVGTAEVPGDKSIGHRALIIGSICTGEVEISGPRGGADNRSTREAMAALGVAIEDRGDTVVVTGRGLDGLREPSVPLDCGNAGTGMRLLCGLAAGQRFPVTLVGDASLTNRPMKRVVAPLGEMGAEITGREIRDNVYPPLNVRGGALVGIDYHSPIASAQVKSAILIAALYADGATGVIEPGSSRDHTERLLAYLGAPLTVPERQHAVLDPSGWDRVLKARPIQVPADPSSAAFVVAAGLVAGVERVSVPNTCINPTRTGFLDVIAAMNGRVEHEAMNRDGSEAVANLVLSRGAGDDLKGTRVDGDLTVRAIDELPILAVIAAFADGETEFADAAELRVKESDRIATTCAMLRAFGVEVEERDDGFTVAGAPGRTLSPAHVDAKGDHRIAMAAAVAACRASGKSRIDDVAHVATSFPGFADLMNRLGAKIATV